MGERDQEVQRVSHTSKFLDKQRDPWEYMDEELPTTTLKLKGALRRVATRAPLGTVAEGSYRVTGSHYDFAPGTYSLRITRVHVAAIGTTDGGFQGTVFQWHLRHSRQGTIDVLALSAGHRDVFLQGGPRTPIYSIGPGTLFWGWDTFKGELGTQVTLIQSMEAIPG